METKATVLIVDDLLPVREVFKGLLHEQGYHLAFASSGLEALTKANELRPDVILLDVMMPDMDGFEVCRRLRANPLLAEVPVIMVTALDDHASLIQGIEAGADDFISKPFNNAELRARVGTIVRLNRYRRLLSARTKFDWVVEQASDGYLVIDDQDKVLYANPQARLFLGLPADEDMPISDTFLNAAHRQYRCEPQTAWQNWPEPGAATSHRYLVRPEAPNSQSFWLGVETLALPPEADEGHQIIHLRDVTTQMNLSRDMWEFQAMVAHKLRTPMTSILTGLRLLKVEKVETWDPQEVQLFEIVLRGANRLHNEVEEVLEYLHTPDLAQPGNQFNLAQLNALISNFAKDLDLQSVTLSIDECLQDAHILLHQRAVELIFLEILSNARKFHPQNAPVIEILVKSLNNHTQISIQICDDGLTLSPEQLAQVWSPFYQGDKYFTGEVAGMGLGLPKVALLVWNTGGTCRIYNRSDGSGVIVELIVSLSNNHQ